MRLSVLFTCERSLKLGLYIAGSHFCADVVSFRWHLSRAFPIYCPKTHPPTQYARARKRDGQPTQSTSIHPLIHRRDVHFESLKNKSQNAVATSSSQHYYRRSSSWIASCWQDVSLRAPNLNTRSHAPSASLRSLTVYRSMIHETQDNLGNNHRTDPSHVRTINHWSFRNILACVSMMHSWRCCLHHRSMGSFHDCAR